MLFGEHLSYQFQFRAVSLFSRQFLTNYRTAVRQCVSVYSYLIKFSFTPSVCILSKSLQIIISCPSVPFGEHLSYQFQFHAVSLYSQPSLTPYRTAVRQCLSVYRYLINFSFTQSVCIHSPIYHLTVHLSVSACRCTVILSTSVSRRQSVFTAQSSTLPYSCPLVPVGVQLSYQFQFHAVSLYSQPNIKPYRTAVRQCQSVYSYLINFSFTPSVCIHSPI